MMNKQYLNAEAKYPNVPNSVKKQFIDLKAKFPSAILLFRKSDSYVAYDVDAIDCANTLGLSLAPDRQGCKKTKFPRHALGTYLPQLIRAGFRIGICDELEAPNK